VAETAVLLTVTGSLTTHYLGVYTRPSLMRAIEWWTVDSSTVFYVDVPVCILYDLGGKSFRIQSQTLCSSLAIGLATRLAVLVTIATVLGTTLCSASCSDTLIMLLGPANNSLPWVSALVTVYLITFQTMQHKLLFYKALINNKIYLSRPFVALERFVGKMLHLVCAQFQHSVMYTSAGQCLLCLAINKWPNSRSVIGWRSCE